MACYVECLPACLFGNITNESRARSSSRRLSLHSQNAVSARQADKVDDDDDDEVEVAATRKSCHLRHYKQLQISREWKFRSGLKWRLLCGSSWLQPVSVSISIFISILGLHSLRSRFGVRCSGLGARIGGGFGSTRGWRLLTKLLPWLNDFVIDLHSIVTVDESIDWISCKSNGRRSDTEQSSKAELNQIPSRSSRWPCRCLCPAAVAIRRRQRLRRLWLRRRRRCIPSCLCASSILSSSHQRDSLPAPGTRHSSAATCRAVSLLDAPLRAYVRNCIRRRRRHSRLLGKPHWPRRSCRRLLRHALLVGWHPSWACV